MIYMLTQEAYSDFSIVGVYEGSDDLDLLTLRKEYESVSDKPNQDAGYSTRLDHWIKWVIERAGLKEISHTEWWLGEYGEPVSIQDLEKRIS